MPSEFSLQAAEALDQAGAAGLFRAEFCFPETRSAGHSPIYLVGNSLGLAPKRARVWLQAELEKWERQAVRGHFAEERPWFSYQENFSASLARLVGAKASEVTVMNSLTVNLHLFMASFYLPTPERFKIVIDASAFPSDRYAVRSQIEWHGFDPQTALVEVASDAELSEFLRRDGDAVALVLLGAVHYLTGEVWDTKAAAAEAHRAGAFIGLDLAHAAGNTALRLHDEQIDFAAWCSYKYLNSGPGAIAGGFVHEKHAAWHGPRLEGWWGNEPATRFQMREAMVPEPGVRAWQLSNPPIFAAAALGASLEIFDKITMAELRQKGDALTLYARRLLQEFFPAGELEFLTPALPGKHAAQLSVKLPRIGEKLKQWVQEFEQEDIYVDFRTPDVLRFAPVVLYNTYSDVFRFVSSLRQKWQKTKSHL